jgi:hypothetical protein
MNKLENLRLYGVLFIVLVTIGFWSFLFIPDFLIKILEFSVIVFLIVTFVSNYGKIKKLDLFFWNNIKFIIWIPLILGTLGALIFHGQEIHYSIWRQRTNFLWLLYPILHLFRIDPKRIVKMMLFIGFFWCCINIIQQFTYPTYYFSSRLEGPNSKENLLRAGVYRFMPSTWHYGMFLAFYTFNLYLFSNKIKYLLLALLSLVSFYYLGTRQFAIALIVCLVFHSLTQKGSKFIFGFLFLFFISLVVYFNYDLLFGKFIEMTNNQVVDNDDYIRFAAFDFFFFDYWKSWFSMLTGNGLPYISSTYGKEVEYIKDYYMYYASDIGIIGSFSNFGIFYVASVFALIFKIVVSKFRKPNYKYLKLFGVNAVVLILTNESFLNASVIPFWCLILYLIDRYRDSDFLFKSN